jgi:hypothetical protein
MDIAEKGVIVRTYESWKISLYRKAKELSVETLDYHAGPLILSREALAELARMMGLHVRKRARAKREVGK